MPFRLRARARHTRLRRRGSGQALVEFALVAPVFFAMFFGIVEFAFIMTTVSGYNFATREGARKGSILGRTDNTVDTQILRAIVGRENGLPFAHANTVDIYKAARDGGCQDSSGNSIVPGTAGCIEDQYTISGASCIQTGSGCPETVSTWPPDARNDSLLDADYLGVHIQYAYTFITGFVATMGTQIILNATSVQRIEPQEFGGGASTAPPPLPVASLRSPAEAIAWGRPGEGGAA